MGSHAHILVCKAYCLFKRLYNIWLEEVVCPSTNLAILVNLPLSFYLLAQNTAMSFNLSVAWNSEKKRSNRHFELGMKETSSSRVLNECF